MRENKTCPNSRKQTLLAICFPLVVYVRHGVSAECRRQRRILHRNRSKAVVFFFLLVTFLFLKQATYLDCSLTPYSDTCVILSTLWLSQAWHCWWVTSVVVLLINGVVSSGIKALFHCMVPAPLDSRHLFLFSVRHNLRIDLSIRYFCLWKHSRLLIGQRILSRRKS